MTTNLSPAATPSPEPDLDLSDPVWAIRHIARAFNISVDRARRHTYRAGFPRPKQGFENHLWCREAVLEWFRGLPEEPPTKTMTERAQHSPAATPTPAASAAPAPAARTAPVPATRPRSAPRYTPQGPRKSRTR